MTQYSSVNDSGERQEFGTGSVRDTREGKGRFDLLPPYALKRLAQHFETGARKYGDRNWEKGQPLSRYLDSASRHLYAYLGGDRSEDHMAAVAWNALAHIETQERVRMGALPDILDDLPGREAGHGDAPAGDGFTHDPASCAICAVVLDARKARDSQ